MREENLHRQTASIKPEVNLHRFLPFLQEEYAFLLSPIHKRLSELDIMGYSDINIIAFFDDRACIIQKIVIEISKEMFIVFTTMRSIEITSK